MKEKRRGMLCREMKLPSLLCINLRAEDTLVGRSHPPIVVLVLLFSLFFPLFFWRVILGG